MRIQLAPNPYHHRRLTTSFWRDQDAHHEDYAAFARTPGLRPRLGEGSNFRLSIDPPSLVRLDRLVAVGTGGHPLLVGDGTEESESAVLDASHLSIGVHDLFACLVHESEPAGPLVEELVGADGQGAGPQRCQLRSIITLEVGEARTRHRDWLQVGRLERIREGGRVQTLLDASFYPPLASMEACWKPNPIAEFATAAMRAVDRVEDRDSLVALQRELLLLSNLANRAAPELVFLQAQRCVLLLEEARLEGFHVDPRLARFTFDPLVFGEFLTQIQHNLDTAPEELYPLSLRVDGTPFLRADGEFVEDDEFWVWRPQDPGFVAREICLFLPHAHARSLPFLRYGMHRDETESYRLAQEATQVSAPGVAFLMTVSGSPIEALHMVVHARGEQQHLALNLREAHAIYYC